MNKLNDINLNHLYYFHVAAEKLNLTQAASELQISQAALSIQIKKLESHLGVDLFIRKKQRVSLSPHGEIAYRYTRETFKITNEMMDTLLDRKVDNSIRVQIGIDHNISDRELNALWAIIGSELEGVEFKIERMDQKEGQKALVEYEIDLLLTSGIMHSASLRDHANFKSQLILEDQLYFARPKRAKSIGHYFILPELEANRDFQKWIDANPLLKLNQAIRNSAPSGLIEELIRSGQSSGLISQSWLNLNAILRKKINLMKIAECKKRFFAHTIQKRIEHPVVEKLFKKY